MPFSLCATCDLCIDLCARSKAMNVSGLRGRGATAQKGRFLRDDPRQGRSLEPWR